jgi:hypothetical protein
VSLHDLKMGALALSICAVGLSIGAYILEHRVIETPEQRAQREALVAAAKKVCPMGNTLVIDFTMRPYAVSCQ